MKCFLINLNQMVLLKAAEGSDAVKRLEYWADILIPRSEFYICDMTNRSKARWTLEELRELYENTFSTPFIKVQDYARALEVVTEAFNEVEADDASIEELICKLGRELKEPDFTPVPEKLPEKGRKEAKAGGLPSSSSRPKEGSMTGRVWEVADWLYGEQQPQNIHCKGLRADIIRICVENDINQATASTQFAKWKNHQNCS